MPEGCASVPIRLISAVATYLDKILAAHQMPLLRLPTTGSREHQQIRQALDNAETHWARLSAR